MAKQFYTVCDLIFNSSNEIHFKNYTDLQVSKILDHKPTGYNYKHGLEYQFDIISSLFAVR